jgi:hypothetical protein
MVVRMSAVLVALFGLSACGGGSGSTAVSPPASQSEAPGLASARAACVNLDVATPFDTQFRPPKVRQYLNAARSAAEADEKYRELYEDYKAAESANESLSRTGPFVPEAIEPMAALRRAVEDLQRQCAHLPE